tara:strand:- start:997 stop:2676 length:1680 start_codon:yes stop_codon:yes gene_type:complete
LILSTLKKLNKIYKDTGFSYKYIFLLSFVTSLTLSVFEGFFLGVIFNLTSSLLGKTYQTINFFENSIFDFQNLNEILILCAVIIIFITLLKILNIFFNTYLYFKINTVVSKKIFKKILFQSIDFHKNINSSKIISTLSEKSKSVGEITFFLLSILRCTCILLMITISTIYISSKEFVLITLIFFLLYFLIYLIFKKKMNNYGIDIANQNDKIIKNIQESLSSIIFILLYKSQKSISNKFYKIVSSLRKSQAKVVFLASVPFIFVQTFGFLLIIYLIYLFDVKDNFVTLIPFLAMGLVAIQRLLPNFNEIFSSISTIKALEQNFIDTQNLVDLKINEVNFDKKINEVNFSKNIRFENVNFSYEKNKFVLNDINLQIQKNSIFGIMGSTGSGKSTIVNLLLGFNRPDKGNIYIDDKILSDSEILNWQENLSYVPQRVYLLDDTIITNITLEEKTNKVNFDLLNEAVKFAELEKFISLQKDGIHHVIGEDADKISGGQKQRIGIARAIYKNTNTLILDESLNSLDNNTKERILNKFKSINKTIVLISHQKNDLKICDEIFEI